MPQPPGPRAPGALQLLAFSRRPIDFLLHCQERYGDVFRARFPGFGEIVYVANPEDAKRVFTGKPAQFHAGEANATAFEPVLGRLSVMTLDEGEHLRQRKLLLPPFHGEAMRSFDSVFADVAAREVDRWPLRRPFPLLPSTKRVTMEVILRAVIGATARSRLRELSAAILRLDRIAPAVLAVPPLHRDLGRYSPWGMFLNARAEVDRLLYREIAERRADPADDVLSLLVSARHEDGSPMSDLELRDELSTLIAAGYETSSSSLAWAFERVLRTPHVLERLLDAPDDDAYLDAVVKETLRVRAPITDATRILTRPAELGGYELPERTQLVVALPLLHLRRGCWDEPHAFRPERWLDGGDAQPYTYVPFGGGVRRCIGAAFAHLETKVMLRTVLERARLRADGDRDEVQRLHLVVVNPSRGARVVVESRGRATKRPAKAAGEPAAAHAAG